MEKAFLGGHWYGDFGRSGEEGQSGRRMTGRRRKRYWRELGDVWE